MFKIIRKTNKVSPLAITPSPLFSSPSQPPQDIQQQNSTLLKLPDFKDLITLDTLKDKNICIVTIYGFGDSFKDERIIHDDIHNIDFYNIWNGSSSFIPFAGLQCYKDLKSVKLREKGKQVINDGSRVLHIYKQLKELLINAEYEKVIVFAISWGAILTLKALWELLRDSSIQSNLDKLHIITIGSPRIIESHWLTAHSDPKLPRILNMYHAKDALLEIYNKNNNCCIPVFSVLTNVLKMPIVSKTYAGIEPIYDDNICIVFREELKDTTLKQDLFILFSYYYPRFKLNNNHKDKIYIPIDALEYYYNTVIKEEYKTKFISLFFNHDNYKDLHKQLTQEQQQQQPQAQLAQVQIQIQQTQQTQQISPLLEYLKENVDKITGDNHILLFNILIDSANKLFYENFITVNTIAPINYHTNICNAYPFFNFQLLYYMNYVLATRIYPIPVNTVKNFSEKK